MATNDSRLESASGSSSAGVGVAVAGNSSAAAATEDDVMSNQEIIDSVLKDRTAEGGAVNKTYSTSLGDSCTWYANQECDKARSCFDCLNTLINGKPCMIDEYGVCVTMANYEASKDFRRPLPPNVLQISPTHFPSANTTYCGSDDQYCNTCRQSWANPFSNSDLSYINFCRGVGGCVCTRSCESQYRNENAIVQRCQLMGFERPSAKMIYTSTAIMAALCLFFAIITMFAKRWVSRFDQRGRRHEEPIPQRQPSGPQLSLSGWRSMRQKLIESEHEQLQSTENPTLATRVIDNTVGPAIVVEQGDGFLPTSPSDLARYRQQHDAPPSSPTCSADEPRRRGPNETRSTSEV